MLGEAGHAGVGIRRDGGIVLVEVLEASVSLALAL
jgi:hypothetical protein